MAHNLNFNKKTGTWSFASRKEKAWHGLGQVVDHAMTSEEAIRLANLDYEVAKSPLFFNSPDPTNAEGFYATHRTDTNDFLGVVKSRYEIVQNRDAFTFFDSIIDSGEAVYETAGVLGNGERIWLLAKLPEDMLVKGEAIEKYVLLVNSHDGTSSLIAALTNVRVVCNNTLQAAMRNLENKVSISHIAGAKDRLKEATRVMGIASKYNNYVAEIFNEMSDYKVDEEGLKSYITKVMTPESFEVRTKDEEKEMSKRLSNIIDSTLEFALTHPTQTTEAANKTLWGAYNSISGYFNYIKNFDTQEDKFRNQLFGNGNQKMLKAFREANSLIRS
jgi:phage/plasmid-like protein (TIGR03299 family)